MTVLMPAEPPPHFFRAIVADDHPMYCEGLAALLADIDADMMINRADRFDRVLAQARQGRSPDLFLLDLNFPGMAVPGSLEILRAEFPKSSIIIISMSDDRDTADRIMAAGADGFLSKSAPPDDMRSAIEAVLAGEFVQLNGEAGLVHPSGIMLDFPSLTSRQIDVLRLLVEGKTNKEIARALDFSPFTVRIHVSAILHQLKVTSRSGAAAIGARYRF